MNGIMMRKPENARTILINCSVVLVAIIICVAAAWTLTKSTVPTYKAQTSQYFSLDVNKSATDLNQGSTYLQTQMVSFAELATSPRVLNPVISELHLNLTDRQLASEISVSIPADSVVLRISATSSSPRGASDIANSVASHTRQAVQDVGPKDASGVPIVLAQSIETATPPDSPSAPNENLNLTIGLVLGVLIGVLALIVWRTYGRKVRSLADLSKDTVVLGSVQDDVQTDELGTLMIRKSTAAEAEGYRRLRENLWAVIGRQDSSSFVLTPVRSTGPSSFPQNLGMTIAETGASVLLVDANLREESHAKAGDGVAKPGLGRLLTDESVTLDDAIQRGGAVGFDFISAGGTCENPGRLMASTRMSDLLKAAKSQYEMIIINCAPARTAADASVLAGLTDGVVLTVEPGHWWQRQFTETMDLLRSSGTVVLGTVVTRRRIRGIKRSAPPAKTAKLHRS